MNVDSLAIWHAVQKALSSRSTTIAQTGPKINQGVLSVKVMHAQATAVTHPKIKLQTAIIVFVSIFFFGSVSWVSLCIGLH